ncbi:hypothetical protein Moror_13974 [Moniliophthora roreri MCA 2997]|uniref:Uncharacterized protein n=1 Tax=Moniliophthora roreri (strain MCA 2997) TaxID=1381753 RepID=V2YTG4_MONRO|nr:hypothetical protein Moror_13974 [Moniliophthora roreri MCA 2997]KAI3607650.1 hypothetical protein WG66_005082 [Moniliophthora roreri]
MEFVIQSLRPREFGSIENGFRRIDTFQIPPTPVFRTRTRSHRQVTFRVGDGQYVLAELGQLGLVLVRFKLNPVFDTLAAKAVATFTGPLTFKEVIGQQLVVLYGAYDTYVTHIINASPAGDLKSRAQVLKADHTPSRPRVK